MPSFYPGGQDTWTTKVDNVTTILATHVNDLQNAVAALETGGYSTKVITYAATVTPNIPDGALQTITLTGNITINNATNPGTGGRVLILQITQDITGKRRVTFGNAYNTTWQPDQAASAVSSIAFWYDGAKWQPFATRDDRTLSPTSGVNDQGGMVYSVTHPVANCVLDGATNDASAFTTWLGTLPAGAIVLIPAGTNIALGLVTVPATIKGFVIDGTVTQFAQGANCFVVDACTKLTFQGKGQMVGVAGTGVSSSLDNAISGNGASGCANIRVLDLDFTTWQGNSCLFVDVNDTVIQDTNLINCSRGYTVQGGRRHKHLGNTANGTQALAATFTIVWQYAVGSTTNTIDIVNAFNVCTGWTNGQSVVLHDAQKATIFGNIWDNMLFGVGVTPVIGTSLAKWIVINANIYVGSASSSIVTNSNYGINVTGLAGQLATHVTIVGNLVDNANVAILNTLGAGIGVNSADHVLVADNDVSNCAAHGILINAGVGLTRVAIRNNWIVDAVNVSGLAEGFRISSGSGITGVLESNSFDNCTSAMRFSTSNPNFIVRAQQVTNCTNRYVSPTNATILEFFGGTQSIATIATAVNIANGNTILVAYAAGGTLAVPTTLNPGQKVVYIFTHDATANAYTITKSASHKLAGAAATLAHTDTASAVDIYEFAYDGTNLKQSAAASINVG